MAEKQTDELRCSGSHGEVYGCRAGVMACWICGAWVRVVPYEHPRFGLSYMLAEHPNGRETEVAQ